MAPHRASWPALAVAAALGAGATALATRLAGGDARQCPAAATAAPAIAAPAPATAGARPVAAAVADTSGHAVRGRARAGVPDPAYSAARALDVDRQVKDLLALPPDGRRDMRGKLADFLAAHPDHEGIALASRGVASLAANRDMLPDAAIAALYLEQESPEFRRVLAQVASLRGDNRLIELHAAEAGLGLHAPQAAERQRALAELARTRHVAAADLAAPLLADHDTGVVLEALLALRATGNERHVALVDALRDHPDEGVRWLARDVAGELRMLSEHARTRVAARDLEAELPPLPPPPIDCALAARG